MASTAAQSENTDNEFKSVRSKRKRKMATDPSDEPGNKETLVESMETQPSDSKRPNFPPISGDKLKVSCA